MTWEILCIFIMMVGEMQRRIEQCIDFAKKRRQFGAPIGTNQYIPGKIVDQKIGVENSRKHLYDTGRRSLEGRSVVTEIAMAKLVTSEANLASALSAVQIFGGRGYMREDGLEKELRAARGRPYTPARTRCSASGSPRCSASSGSPQTSRRGSTPTWGAPGAPPSSSRSTRSLKKQIRSVMPAASGSGCVYVQARSRTVSSSSSATE